MNMNKFRLRSFVNRLIELGEVEIHDEPVPLSELSRIIEASPKAKLFRKAGPEQVEVAAAVCGSRSRLAAAFGLDYREIAHEYMRRMAQPQPTVEVPSRDAPVHEVVLAGADADLTLLPFHVQHEFDGGTYISSAIDYTVDPQTGRTNVGCRRLMLRGRHEMRANLTNNSDLKKIYLKCLERGERLARGGLRVPALRRPRDPADPGWEAERPRGLRGLPDDRPAQALHDEPPLGVREGRVPVQRQVGTAGDRPKILVSPPPSEVRNAILYYAAVR